MINLLTAIVLTPGGSSTVHIYTQTVHRTTQLTIFRWKAFWDSNPESSDIDIFVNCNWVDTRWQQYSTHLHTDSTQNNTINNFGSKAFWDSNPESSDIDIFVNCNWVDTQWQYYSTHLHTNNTQNNTINFGWKAFWDSNP